MNLPDHEKDFFYTAGASEFLSRSPGAIRNLVMRRQIPYRKVGGRLMFLRKELTTWIEQAPGVRLDEIDSR